MTHNPHLSLIQNQYLQKTLRFYPDSLISTTSPQSIASTFPPSAPYPSSIPPTPRYSFLLIYYIYCICLIYPTYCICLLSAYCICLIYPTYCICLIYPPQHLLYLSTSTHLKFICLIISHLQNNHKNNHSKIWSVQKKVVTLHRISEKRPKLNI